MAWSKAAKGKSGVQGEKLSVQPWGYSRVCSSIHLHHVTSDICGSGVLGKELLWLSRALQSCSSALTCAALPGLPQASLKVHTQPKDSPVPAPLPLVMWGFLLSSVPTPMLLTPRLACGRRWVKEGCSNGQGLKGALRCLPWSPYRFSLYRDRRYSLSASRSHTSVSLSHTPGPTSAE